MAWRQDGKCADIDNPQSMNTKYPRLVINNGHTVTPDTHFARTGRMINCHHGLLDNVNNIRIALIPKTGKVLRSGKHRSHCLALERFAHAPVSRHRNFLVRFGVQPIWIDDWGVRHVR